MQSLCAEDGNKEKKTADTELNEYLGLLKYGTDK